MMTETFTRPDTDLPPVYDPPCEARHRNGNEPCPHPAQARVRYACTSCEGQATAVLCDRCLSMLKAGKLYCKLCNFAYPLYLVEVL